MNEHNSPLVELIYYSRSINSLTEDDFNFLLDGARQKNHKRNITGAIVYSGRVFLQLIEGPREQINQLFQSISHDARHYDVSLVSFRTVGERRFPEWEMNYLSTVDKPIYVDRELDRLDLDTCLTLFADLAEG